MPRFCLILAALLALPIPGFGQAAVRFSTLSDDVAVLFDSRVADATLTAVRTGDGLILIDALSSPEAGAAALELLSDWSSEPVRFLIQTHAHGDHVWGSQSFPSARRIASEGTARYIPEDLRSWASEQRTHLDSLEARLARSTDEKRRASLEGERTEVLVDLDIMSRVQLAATLPHDTIRADLRLELGRHSVFIRVMPIAHTEGDVVVHIPTADLLVTGDLVFGRQLPFVPGTAAGDLAPLIAVHRTLMDMTEPTTHVVSGHRAPGGPDLIRDRLGYLEALQEAIREHQSRGVGLEAAKEEIVLPGYQHLARFHDFHPANLEWLWTRPGASQS